MAPEEAAQSPGTGERPTEAPSPDAHPGRWRIRLKRWRYWWGRLLATLWRDLLTTPGGAALLTIFLGSFLVNSVANCVQRRAQYEELLFRHQNRLEELYILRNNTLAEMASRSENQCSAERRQAALDAHGKVLTTITSAKTYLSALRGHAVLASPERDVAAVQANGFREAHLAGYREWLVEKEKDEINLGYFFTEAPAVKSAWITADLAAMRFTQCAAALKVADSDRWKECEDGRTTAEQALSSFRLALDAAWASPCPVQQLPDSEKPPPLPDDLRPVSLWGCFCETLGLGGGRKQRGDGNDASRPTQP